MLFIIFTIITFIAECILAIFIIAILYKFDKYILELNNTVELVNPKMSEILCLIKKISEQVVILSKDFVSKFNVQKDEIIIKSFAKFLLGLFLLKTNSRYIRRLRKSKAVKLLGKGLSLLENVV